jgi:hypothetical protein
VAIASSAGDESVVWLPVLFLLVAWAARSIDAATGVLLIMLVLSPGFWRELSTGGDLIPCVTAVCVCLALLQRPWSWPLLGAALCWRPNLALSAILFLARLGPSRALAATSAAAATFLLATLPFALHDTFTPWDVSNRLESYSGVVPGGAWILLRRASQQPEY